MYDVRVVAICMMSEYSSYMYDVRVVAICMMSE